MSDYSRERLLDVFRKKHIGEHWIAGIFKELDRPEFVKKVGVIYCYKVYDLDHWNAGIASNTSTMEDTEYRRPNPQELGLAMKFVKCVHADIKAETRYWEGYDRAIDHCNKLMGWDSDE
jgi:hypothetical protein